jgi:hypothetical protein
MIGRMNNTASCLCFLKNRKNQKESTKIQSKGYPQVQGTLHVRAYVFLVLLTRRQKLYFTTTSVSEIASLTIISKGCTRYKAKLQNMGTILESHLDVSH